MCGRFTYKLTWAEIVKLYRLTLDQPARNTQPRYNICPTTTIDTIVSLDGKCSLVPMRWGLIPGWWSKPLKEMKLATFNARAKTVATKPMFRDAFKSKRLLIPASGYTSGTMRRVGQAAVLFHAARRSTDHVRGAVVELEKQRERRIPAILHDGDHGDE
jgi:putative SOS response-associated peptidase YedK